MKRGSNFIKLYLSLEFKLNKKKKIKSEFFFVFFIGYKYCLEKNNLSIRK